MASHHIPSSAVGEKGKAPASSSESRQTDAISRSSPIGHVGDGSFEASVRIQISAIVDDLIQQIAFPALPTGSMPFEDPGASVLLMRRFLHITFAKGIPSYADYAHRANSFFEELDSLNMDPSSCLDTIRNLGEMLIRVEAVRKFRAEFSLCPEATTVLDLRVQYREARRELEEVEDHCHILQAQQESLDREIIVAHHEVEDLQHQLAEAQARLASMRTQRTHLGLELEAQNSEGTTRARRLSKLHHDKEQAQVLSDRTVQMSDFLNQMEESSSKEVSDRIAQLLRA